MEAEDIGMTPLLRAAAEDIEMTPLMRAAADGEIRLVRHIIRGGDDVNFHGDRSRGNTALFYAAINGHTEVVKLILKAGADVDHKNIFFNTACVYAVSFGEVDVVKVLTEAGASICDLMINSLNSPEIDTYLQSMHEKSMFHRMRHGWWWQHQLAKVGNATTECEVRQLLHGDEGWVQKAMVYNESYEKFKIYSRIYIARIKYVRKRVLSQWPIGERELELVLANLPVRGVGNN